MFRKKNGELLQIDCNSALRKNLLRISGFLLPLWGIFAPLVILCTLADPQLSPWLLLMLLPMIFGPISFVCWRRFLQFDSTSITFPGLNTKKYEIAKLRHVKLKNENLLFHFESSHSKNTDEIVQIDSSRLSPNARSVLVHKLDNLCIPLDENSRRKFISCQSEHFDTTPDRPAILTYDLHSRLRAFREVISQYEHIFWKIWVGTQIPALIAITPLIILVPYIAVLKLMHESPAADPLNLNQIISPWGSFWTMAWGIATVPIAIAGNSYFSFVTSSMVSKCLFAVLGVVIAGLFATLLTKPNRIEISKEGIELQLRLALMTFTIKSLRWKDLLSAKLLRTKSGKVDDQKIILKSKEALTGWMAGAGDHEIELSNNGIIKQEDKNLLLKALRTFAPQCEMDSEMIENLIPVKKHNYTELWLESLNSPPKRERLKPLREGDRLQSGKFEVKEIIGSGGQGIAYLSMSNTNDQKPQSIVIKEFMLPVYVDRRARSQAVERFETEARVLASLESESIVKLKDHFIEDHRAYLVLEYISGPSLRKLVQKHNADGKLGLDEATLQNLAAQMCDILTFLHERPEPLVHRDFTPDNLILDETGRLKLIDFNVVHLANLNKTSVTIVGKHAYMPPEQFAGRPVPQSDLYALGATIYYLLTGEEPEPFTELQLPATLLDERENLSRRWQEIISACTKLNVAERINSAAEVKLMLEYVGATPLIATIAEAT